MPTIRAAHLKRVPTKPELTPREKLQELLARFAPKPAIAKKPKKETAVMDKFRRPVTKSDALRIYRLRHGADGKLLSFKKVGEKMRMPTMTTYQAYTRFCDNGLNFVDGRLRNGNYPHGKLVGSVAVYLLDRNLL